MSQITWKIENVEREAESGLVTTVHWRVNGSAPTGVEDKTVNSTSYGAVTLERGEEFIAFEDLTEQTVLQWVKDKLGKEYVDSIEMSIERQLQSQLTPPTVSGLPSAWTTVV